MQIQTMKIAENRLNQPNRPNYLRPDSLNTPVVYSSDSETISGSESLKFIQSVKFVIYIRVVVKKHITQIQVLQWGARYFF